MSAAPWRCSWSAPARLPGSTRSTRALAPTTEHWAPPIELLPSPSGWNWTYEGSLQGTFTDRCPFPGPFEFRVVGGPLVAGQSIDARWTAAAGTDLTGVTMRWIGDAQPDPSRGEGTVELTLATDRQTLLSQNSPLAISPSGPTPNLESGVQPARWFEIRFRCLDSCPSPSIRGWVHKAWFDVDDSAPPVGGLTGSAADAQTWSGSMRFGFNGAELVRAWPEQ